jgi:hypothetical protein
MEPTEPAPAAREATPVDAAEHYRVALPTVYGWAQRGEVKARKTEGGKWMIDLDDMGRLVRDRATRRPLTAYDRDLAHRVAKALLPLTDNQRRRLAKLLLGKSGQRFHDAA